MVEQSRSIAAVEIISSIQVLPELELNHPTTVPLSIIDSTVSYFSRAAAIWFFDSPASSDSAISISNLQNSLSKTLNSYRQFCGHLKYAVPQSHGGHTERYRRVHVTYNTHTDQGVRFITANSPNALAHFVPKLSIRRSLLRAWDVSNIPSGQLLLTTPMALSRGAAPDAPNAIIQVTRFSCGSTSIGLAITHGLSDAHSMCTFAKDWAAVSRALHAKKPLPTLSPIFDPGLLDAAAAGDIDVEMPDLALVEKARKLPFHRFDWYKEVPGQPWPVSTPDDFDREATLSPSVAIPWDQWDTAAPTAGRVIYFTPSKVDQIYNVASMSSISRISKHDALLAHLWTRINVARRTSSSATNYMDLTFGLRQRLGLPQNFMGSPIMIMAVPFPMLEEGDKDLKVGSVADGVRKQLKMMGRDEIGACLHDAAFEVSPQRLWQACLGRNHVLQTSWVSAGFQEVDFVGTGGPELIYVHPEMGGDGLLLLMEGLGEKKGHWTANGVDVCLYLEAKSMDKLLGDSKLWGEGIA